MIISESWLREWVSPDISTDALAEMLTQAGLEVETVTRQTLLGDKVLVGKITNIEKHPDADKLNVCEVDVGLDDPLTIVCGAANARKDLVAPVALVGAVLPGDFEIGAREVRGIASSGMICSASELGLEDQSDGLLELDSETKIGILIDDALALDDASIDIDLTPDRGDCLSIAGVARDIAALSKSALTVPVVNPVASVIEDTREVALAAPEACACYVGRIIKNISLDAQTPDYMREKLRRVGVRSISAVVDVTNYVMLELGQPMHAFDLAKVEGGITVRMADKGESLELLDGQILELQDDMLVIADDQKPIALAGIMGGANSEIDSDTQDILLESAFFSPLVIAGKARALGLHTDASHRFERGVDPALQETAIERATSLLLDIVGGEPGPVFAKRDEENLPSSDVIELRPQRIRDSLGLAVEDNIIEQHLLDLQMSVESSAVPWKVIAPSWRSDITGAHDLVEEIGRLEGLDKIEPIMPKLRAKPYSEREKTVSQYTLKTWLAGREYREVVSYSFIEPKDQAAVMGDIEAIEVANPIASNMSQMRLSILPGLLNSARTNEQRHHTRIRLLEIGNIFVADKGSDTGASESSKLAIVAGGSAHSGHWSDTGRALDLYDVKGDLEMLFDRVGIGANISFVATDANALLHPGQAANIVLDNKIIGHIGTLHPQVQKHFDLDQTYVVVEMNLETLLNRKIPAFTALSKYPETTRDLALVVEENVRADDIMKEIQDNSGKLLKKCELFDIYSGENIQQGYKSLAFSLSLQSDSKSLESEFVDTLINKLLDSLKIKFGATLRS